MAETMKRLSYREYRIRLAWEADQWNKPSRTDYYLMEVAAEVRRKFHKTPESVKSGHFKINFVPKEAAIPITREQAAARAKSKWAGAIGLTAIKSPRKQLRAKHNGR